jgi:hypothetical protein
VKNNVLIDNEALRARLNIRDFFIENAVRQIYDNVGQVLSLVRMDLDVVRSDRNLVALMQSAGQLVAQSIRDLRFMSKNFNPDTHLLQHAGFTESTRRVIEILYPKNAPLVSFKEQQIGMQPEVKLIAFSMLLKMLISIKEAQKTCSEVIVSSTRTALQIALRFKDKSAKLIWQHKAEEFIGLTQTVALLDGEFRNISGGKGMTTWKLKIPLK